MPVGLTEEGQCWGAVPAHWVAPHGITPLAKAVLEILKAAMEGSKSGVTPGVRAWSFR